MACACHGKNGETAGRRVPPDDQCTMCASKHLSMARTAWGEFTYEPDNRWWVASHLRLAVEHLKLDHKDLALEIRDIAAVIETARDGNRTSVRDSLERVCCEARELMYADHPDIRKRELELEDI